MLFDRDVAVWEREREHLAPLHYKEQQRATKQGNLLLFLLAGRAQRTIYNINNIYLNLKVNKSTGGQNSSYLYVSESF